jgi:hypothetical protein
MAYYDALIAKWATLTPGTTAAKLTQINAATALAPAVPAVLPPHQLINAIVFADLAALDATQMQRLTLLLSGSTVDVSPNTTIRLGMQSLFAGKTQTLQNLGALVQPFDNRTVPWWQSAGYSSPISEGDLAAAGGLT